MSIAGRIAERKEARARKRDAIDARAEAVSADAGRCAGAVAAAPSKATPARLRHLYSSRDDVLSVFEDAAGHVVAVNSKRLV